MGERGQTIDGTTAWTNLAGSKGSRWLIQPGEAGYAQAAHGRIASGLVLPRIEPKFRLREDDRFFCIGSCFARNIEEHLIYRGLEVMSLSAPFGTLEWRPNSVVNKYTPGSILNELRWALAGEPFPPDALIEHNGGWRDLQLTGRVPALPRENALSRRAQVTQYFQRLRNATVVIVTLGLVETWYDTQTGVALNAAPSLWMTRRWPGRFNLIVTNWSDTVRTLHEIYALLAGIGPDVRVIVTVSPVPMSETFSGQDVIVANTYSKSTLRAAADDSARDSAAVQYYPSFETITVSNRALTYNAADSLHVLDTAVEAIAEHFLTTYGLNKPRPHPEFIELDYLFANRDVHEAVLEQRVGSGYEHWLATGRAEGRPLRATQRADWVERLVGP